MKTPQEVHDWMPMHGDIANYSWCKCCGVLRVRYKKEDTYSFIYYVPEVVGINHEEPACVM